MANEVMGLCAIGKYFVEYDSRHHPISIYFIMYSNLHTHSSTSKVFLGRHQNSNLIYGALILSLYFFAAAAAAAIHVFICPTQSKNDEL